MVLAVIDDDEISLRNVVLLVPDPINSFPLGHKVNLKAIVRMQEEVLPAASGRRENFQWKFRIKGNDFFLKPHVRPPFTCSAPKNGESVRRRTGKKNCSF